MRESGPQRLYFEPVHFNVFYKGRGVDNRVSARDIKDQDPATITRIWVVEQKRQATDEEIKQLCAGTWTS